MENYIEFVFWGEDGAVFSIKTNQIKNIRSDNSDIHGHVVVHVDIDVEKKQKERGEKL